MKMCQHIPSAAQLFPFSYGPAPIALLVNVCSCDSLDSSNHDQASLQLTSGHRRKCLYFLEFIVSHGNMLNIARIVNAVPYPNLL